MPRSGPEPKPEWRSVPSQVRLRTNEELGARVVRAMRAWGGYGPSPTFRLRLDDGRRAFFKAASPDTTEFARVAHDRELRVYRELGGLIGPWAPRLLGTFDAGAWRVMLFEDLGPKSAPPWTPLLVRRVARALGELHSTLRDRRLPDWIPRPADHPAMGIRPPAWTLSAEDRRMLAGVAVGQERAAEAWLAEHAPALAAAAARTDDPAFDHSLLHVDVRSDNLRWVHGKLYLFDWPHVGVGPPEFDAAAFAQTVTVENGPDPDTVMAWYGESWPTNGRALDAAVAAIAGYFARNAWLPGIPQLPRVRAFQRAQLAVSLRWAARRLGMPEPAWLDHVGPSGSSGTV